jgi:putative ABC transport system ATP-binding protein
MVGRSLRPPAPFALSVPVDAVAGGVSDFATTAALSRAGSTSVSLVHAPETATLAARTNQYTLDAALMLVARQLTKRFPSGGQLLTVLHDVSFTIADGEFVAIVGPSGSGKTTLLGLLAGLDTPTSGGVLLDGTELTRLSEDERARLRGEKVGFVFQSFQLIPTLTAAENVQVVLELRGERGAPERARDLLGRVGLGDRVHHYPAQLSGGEQQRVAIARAFVNAPRVLFADEPTGNLDSATGHRIIELLESINREARTTVVLVTHDPDLAARAHRVIQLSDGAVVHDSAMVAA